MATGPARWAAARARITELIAGWCGAGRRGLPAGRGRAPAAVRGGRLRRLLRLRAPRVEPRAAVPAGQPRAADAELEAPAGRLPRPGRHGRGLRHRHRPPQRPAQGTVRSRAGVRPVRPARHRGRARLRGRRRLAARHDDRDRGVRRPRVRRRSSSTTGPPATCRPGSTCRSGRTWASRSRPRSRPGWCRWRPCRPPGCRCPARTRRCCRTCGRARTGASTSTWPCHGTAR